MTLESFKGLICGHIKNTFSSVYPPLNVFLCQVQVTMYQLGPILGFTFGRRKKPGMTLFSQRAGKFSTASFPYLRHTDPQGNRNWNEDKRQCHRTNFIFQISTYGIFWRKSTVNFPLSSRGENSPYAQYIHPCTCTSCFLPGASLCSGVSSCMSVGGHSQSQFMGWSSWVISFPVCYVQCCLHGQNLEVFTEIQ